MPASSEVPSGAGFARAVVDAARNASVGVVVARETAEGLVVELANERAVTLLGRAPSIIPSDFGFSDEPARVLERWLGERTSAPITLEAVAAPGAPSTLRVVGSRVSVDGTPALVFFFYDAGPAGAERALAESEARFRRLLDLAPDPIALGTADRFIYANPVFVRTLGYAAMSDVTAVPLFDHIHPDDRPLARRIAKRVLSTGRPEPATKLRAIRKDGSSLQVDLRVLAIEWGGEPALIGISRDLTERRDTQAQLIRADRLSAMGTLAAGVAHEINNPLAYLMLNLQYLMRELPRFDGEPARLSALLERLAEAEHGARRVSSIVGDLKSFARPEQHDRGPVSVPQVVMAAAKVAGPQIRERARLVEVYEDVPLVEASALRLEQVFINLLVNAAHAIPEGKPNENRISVTVRAEADRVVVEVSDTGTGIPKDALPRVFDPFFTTKPRGVGTGLGLPISRGIVISSGGDIGVVSETGVGTTFRVSFPALPPSDRPPPPSRDFALPKPEPSAPGASFAPLEARARILVVDDEPLVADMLRRALSDAHDVEIATDAEAGLDYVIDNDDLDLVFCDLLMPRMTGMDLYDELKRRRPGVEAKLVFMTGGAFTERAAEFLASVPNPKMSKPFDLVELERVVSRALRRRDA
ncbi:MAG TPA: ATP-binding protein [Polyangiaceae bacterium]|nr:ATP-binding protein [Polyangiaceae bacterium]